MHGAVERRGGLDDIRWMGADKGQEVVLGVEVSASAEDERAWTYELGMVQGKGRPQVSHERVLDPSGKLVLDRKATDEGENSHTLTQTHLERAPRNRDFAEIPALLAKVRYRHLVPQLLRQAGDMQGHVPEGDPYGQGLLMRMAETPAKRRGELLGKIGKLLRAAVPGLEGIALETDKATGRPHLCANYTSGCGNGATMREGQMSDGTLCLIGLAWSLLESEGLLLLEEPGLYLHERVVQCITGMLYWVTERNQRQFFISTHSAALLADNCIPLDDVILLLPGRECTEASLSSEHELARLMSEEFEDPISESAIPLTEPRNSSDISLSLR